MPWYASAGLMTALVAVTLSGLIVARIGGRSGEAKVTAAKAYVASLSGALDTFQSDTGRFPAAEGLGGLVRPPQNAAGWRGPYVKRIPNDPWGNPYVYHLGSGGTTYDVLSAGPDGQVGTDDDVVVMGFAPRVLRIGPGRAATAPAERAAAADPPR